MRVTPLVSGIAIGLTGYIIGTYIFLVMAGIMIFTNGCGGSIICTLIFYTGFIVQIAATLIGLGMAIRGLFLPAPPKDPRYHNIPWPKENAPQNLADTSIVGVILPPKGRHASSNNSEKIFRNSNHNDLATKKSINRQGVGYLHPEGGTRVWKA